MDGVFGRVPHHCVEDFDEKLRAWLKISDIEGMVKVVTNAYAQYMRSRPAAASESIKRSKQVDFNKIDFSPVFKDLSKIEGEEVRNDLLQQMKSYKPNATIFEINSTGRSSSMAVMKQKREYHDRVIARQKLCESLKTAAAASGAAGARGQSDGVVTVLSTDNELQEAFTTVIGGGKARDIDFTVKGKKAKKFAVKDDDNYIPYRPKDFQSEKGLTISSSFENDAAAATLDITGDDKNMLRKLNNSLKWDRKKKKFVGANGKDANAKKIKTESGQWIKASYKTNVYNDWLRRSKTGDRQSDDDGSDDEPAQKRAKTSGRGADKLQVLGGGARRGFHKKTKDEPPAVKNKFRRTTTKTELKRTEQILKGRKEKEKAQNFQNSQLNTKKKRKAMKGKKKFGGKA